MTREEQIQQAAEALEIKVISNPWTLFQKGAEWADQHTQWIPVEEYPKVDISCTLLVHYVDGTIDICDYYGDFYDYTGENVTRNVTHWMPLPAPPKKGD